VRTDPTSGRRSTAWLAVLTLVCASLVTLVMTGPAAADPCAPLVNPVACENSKPGTPAATWDVSGAGSATIQGFTTDISANVGETIRFKVNTPARSYRVDIYRLGYYAGLGARAVASVTPSVPLPQTQPSCRTQAATGLVDCGNWTVSASWTVPADTVSGVFVAKLVRTDGTAGASHVPFVVRNDASRSALLLQTSDTTWQAYNRYGGNSLYVGAPAGRAYKVSYNRPITTRGTNPEDSFFAAEYPMVRFLEANGYDVSYTSGVDTDRRGALLTNHEAFVSVGHDEYWSGQQRAHVEAARSAGVHLVFFSGNEVFWKTRWEPSIDGSGTAHRTLVSYKETKADAKIDPTATWTGTWRDARFSPPSDGGRPENGLTGTLFMVNGGTSRRDSIQVPEADGKMRFWRGTDVANQSPGQTATMPAGTLGYEWDAELDNGARPAGLVRLSDATYDISGDYLLDEGDAYGSGSANHALTLYRAPSGALVFGAGTVQWSWGLDATHDLAGTQVNASMRQATVNLLADMEAQPATIQSGLSLATRSTDTAAPTSTITAPARGSTVALGTPVTITGTATDTGGGRVGGVEVSTDGGATWRRAPGRASWSYTWTPTSSGNVTLQSRAADDSGNLETPSAGTTVTVGAASCPCTLFGSRQPAVVSDSDASAVELGVKFRAATTGTVTGIRFHKGPGNTGTHTGSLWSSSGTRLATVTFSGESASGWQSMSFPSPVAVEAGTTYVASYYAPVGRYSKDERFFATSGTTSGPLTALANGVAGPNGVYLYGAGGGFPQSSYQSSNYWVDVVFTSGSGGGSGDTVAPSVTGVAPAAGATGVSTGTTVSATFDEPVAPSSGTFTLTGPTGSVAASREGSGSTVTLRPASALAPSTTYTAAISGVRDAAGNTTATGTTWSFTTAAAPSTGCPCSLFSPTDTPAVLADPDTVSVEVGVKVVPGRDGTISAIRFYKASTNTGTHVVRLWTSAGTLLSTATASGETASGWQTVRLPTAVPVSTGTTYVASYRAPTGRYSVDEGAFTSARTVGPLTAPASGTSGGNGVYTYGAAGSFPSLSYAASNYWVDVVFS
jgi:hypothetical protein